MEENAKNTVKEGLLAAEKTILSLQRLFLKEGETKFQVEYGLSKIKLALRTIEEDGLSEEEKERKRLERKYKQKLEERKQKNQKKNQKKNLTQETSFVIHLR